ncbi:MAG: SCP2 sterol-binding domain-containing protein [Myxococcales bacterium]|nr:SCP2 sterol-binding domain-containing protein [Myxococcales bacterium]
MAVDPIAFCMQRLPELYAELFPQLASELQQALRERTLSGTVTFAGEGGTTLALIADAEGLQVRKGETAEEGFGYALELPLSAASFGLDEIERERLLKSGMLRVMQLLPSSQARQLLAQGYVFDATVKEVPVLGEVRARVALGKSRLPARCEFSLEVTYDDLEDAREEGVAPHQFFLAGKMKMDGDVAKAMMLGMTLAQFR